MISKICFIVDASRSMSKPFQGNDQVNKIQAVSKAFTDAFARPLNRKDLKLELFTYKASGFLEQEVDFSRINAFPSAYSFKALNQIKPDGSSPLLEAIIRASDQLGKTKNDKKAIAVITGDCQSNHKLKIEDIESKIIPLLLESRIEISILQAGCFEEQLHNRLTKALQSVIINKPQIGPKLALTIPQMKTWIQAFIEKY